MYVNIASQKRQLYCTMYSKCTVVLDVIHNSVLCTSQVVTRLIIIKSPLIVSKPDLVTCSCMWRNSQYCCEEFDRCLIFSLSEEFSLYVVLFNSAVNKTLYFHLTQ